MPYEDKCGSCLFFKPNSSYRSKRKGDCGKHSQVSYGVAMCKPKCKKYKPRVEDFALQEKRG